MKTRALLLSLLASTAVVVAAACDGVHTLNPTPTPTGTTPGGSPTPTGSANPTPTGTGLTKVLLEARCTTATCPSAVTGTLVSDIEDCSSHAVQSSLTHVGVTLANDQVIATNSFLAQSGGAGFICICTYLDVNVNGALDTGDLWGQFSCPSQILVNPGTVSTNLTFLAATHS